MKNTVQLTKKGFEQLKKELAVLKNKKRPHVVKRLSNARAQGDLSENSDYTAAKEELDFIDGRIAELEEILKNAQVVIRANKKDTVDVGTKVKVSVNGQEHTFYIVGEWEADPKEKKISAQSPLGKALIGRKAGERVEVEAPAGKIEYLILEVE